MKNNKGFVVSAVLYPLLVIFLALIMGLLAMTDTRKRILDKMKLEISDSIFDEEACSCDTILSKLNYLIKNGASGGGGGSYTHNVLGLSVTAYEMEGNLPTIGNSVGDIGVITDVEIANYYVSTTAPETPKEGTVWIVQDRNSEYYIESDYSKIGISYVMQYVADTWTIRKAFVFDNVTGWTQLYYIPVSNGEIDLTSSELNGKVVYDFSYTGEYQTFIVPFSGNYEIELWGASGGGYDESRMNTYAGKGAYTKGTIYLEAGTELHIYVGGTSGTSYHDATLTGISKTGKYTIGGWNGGGAGTYYDNNNYGKGGGGATDIRLVSTDTKTEWNEFNSLKSRIMVAAGGGGYMYISDHLYGGDGGTLTGDGGHNTSKTVVYGNGAKGGTQMIGGEGTFRAIDDEYDGGNGGFGFGGVGSYHRASGGGGGYYGGGGGGHDKAMWSAGAGGSSYISGYKGCNAIDVTSTEDNIIHTGSSYHYSGYYFDDAEMTAAANTGNGKATITLKSIYHLLPKEKEQILTQEKEENDNQWEYTYTGDYEAFTAPYSGTYKIELWGAAGGAEKLASVAYAGKGGYTTGEIYLEKGTTLYVYVGGQGGFEYADSKGWTGASTYYSSGGWNGGGAGRTTGTDGNANATGAGGGGATDIRLVSGNATDFNSLKSRIMVAAGGGGALKTASSTINYGGNGGGLNGSHGHNTTITHTDVNAENGATQSSGGFGVFRADNVDQSGLNGTFGIGGDGANNYGSGGGGGYYGGGGGGHMWDRNIAAGGGSSYISGYAGSNSIAETSTATNIESTGSAYHYSGYYFKNADMTAGVNDTDGKAVITLVDKKDISSSAIENDRVNGDKTWVYEYSGSYQTFTVPVSGTYKVELWGASGGYYTYDQTARAGLGAYTTGSIYLEKGTKLYVYVGGHGGNYWRNAIGTNGGRTTSYSTGGYNGGGEGHYYNNYNVGLGGGGATDIRLVSGSASNFESLKSRIMVAAGGGGVERHGNSDSSPISNGVHGGTLEGMPGRYSTTDGPFVNGALGGSQTSGGEAASRIDNAQHTGVAGSFGQGGAGSYLDSSGGGGGYYGGGGGGHNRLNNYIGAGSGSSFISGYTGCNAVAESSTQSNITHTGSAYHYSGYYFTGSSMSSGENLGNGKALITLQSTETKTAAEVQTIQANTENEWHFTYSGNYQTFTVPVTGTYEVTLNGAEGGYYASGQVATGGNGATTKGNIYLTAGTKLYVYVGGKGGRDRYNALETGSSPTNYISIGGWNGGGDGRRASDNQFGMGGGGATDIRLVAGDASDFDSLKSRIMVAAGGGGALYDSGTGHSTGGNGGTLEGADGQHLALLSSANNNLTNGAKGGTQTSGGTATHRADNTQHIGVNGSFGQGGDGSYYSGSGGGGGYYGGGGGGHNYNVYMAAAGGSSYISGYTGCNSIAENSTASNVIHTGSSYHYSGYYFTGTSMEEGTTEGNGSAVIKLISRDTQEDTTTPVGTEFSYTYSGTAQTFTVPQTGYYNIQLWGAQGGYFAYGHREMAGKGAYTSGRIYLTKGTKLYVYVGGQGGMRYFNASGWTGYSTYYSTGGWNGGGDGTYHNTSNYGNGGGGATDIRTVVTASISEWNEEESLRSRIMVAAGGAGYMRPNTDNYGASGGGLTGYNGRFKAELTVYDNSATGGTQTSGGIGALTTNQVYGEKTSTGGDGGFGFGGTGSYYYSSGGGSGWYGGGGGGSATGKGYMSAGSGSSYISGHAGCIGVTASGKANAETYTDMNDSLSHTGFKFTNTVMIDGYGYSWTDTVSTDTSGMPTYDGTDTMIGNSGNGYAKITYLGV